MTATATPLVDVLKASLFLENDDFCQGMAELLGACDAPALESRIREACAAAQADKSPGQAAVANLAKAFKAPLAAGSQAAPKALRYFLRCESRELLAIFDDIVYPLFLDPQARVAVYLR